MNRIIDSRGSGKTKQLMLYAKEHNAIFVCENPLAMNRKAYDYGIFGIEFMSYSDFIYKDDDERDYVIDELENYVKMYGSHLIGYTLTNED